ncbi:hypothetical protein C8D87_114100 [Lentzea atacamensis]|uniref:Uncharacterized protein n=1 Tax=Lentzea atacamensis TaxID=531938 RepID=A0ABX9DXP4_9PSEU|nr:hypothetical protein [Lentzea atacamensis]RAS59488.1 hypothetical protein C8D87_114100 [Lentzea atacamensis]
MSGTDLVVFDTSVSIPPPLSLQVRRCPLDSYLSVIVIGPLGAVELQVRPELLHSPGGGMSLEYHSRQPRLCADTEMADCEVLGGDTCFPDGITGGTQSTFEPWFRARDGQAVVDELVRRYLATSWAVHDEQAVALEPGLYLPSTGEVSP